MSDADLVQRTPEWLQARTGSIGGTRIRPALSKLKSGAMTQAAQDLLYEIAAEQLTGVPARTVNAAQWGVAHEQEARELYVFLTNAEVREVGLIPHPTIAHAHASPDALVGDDGGLEVKCPTSGTHLKTLLADAVPEEHLPQIYWSLACSGRSWWDFMSFDPRFPAGMQIVVKRVARDEEVIGAMEQEARAFLAEVDGKIAALRERLGLAG